MKLFVWLDVSCVALTSFICECGSFEGENSPIFRIDSLAQLYWCRCYCRRLCFKPKQDSLARSLLYNSVAVWIQWFPSIPAMDKTDMESILRWLNRNVNTSAQHCFSVFPLQLLLYFDACQAILFFQYFVLLLSLIGKYIIFWNAVVKRCRGNKKPWFKMRYKQNMAHSMLKMKGEYRVENMSLHTKPSNNHRKFIAFDWS